MFVKNIDTISQPCGDGVTRKILAHDGGLMMVEVSFNKGAVGEVHKHPHEQISYIASGSFEFDIAGNKKIVEKGDSIYIPKDAAHGVLALEDSVIVDVFTPQREDFLN